MTDAAGGEPHQHLARLGLGEVDIGHHQGLTELLKDCCSYPHGGSSRARVTRRNRRPRASAVWRRVLYRDTCTIDRAMAERAWTADDAEALRAAVADFARVGERRDPLSRSR